MSDKKMKLTAAVIAVALALVLVLVPQRAFNGRCAPLPAEAARALQSGKDSIDAVELAKWIAEGVRPLQLVDVRDMWEYEDWHLKDSVNIPAAVLAGGDLGKLSRGRTIVLLSSDGSAASAAWTIVRSAGLKALVLKGGLAAWWEKVMTPLSLQRDRAGKDAAAMKALREWFAAGGAKPPAGAVKTPEPATPAPAAAPPAETGPEEPAAPPARKGGC
jgi:rhodanese-related sulfurtransferase